MNLKAVAGCVGAALIVTSMAWADIPGAPPPKPPQKPKPQPKPVSTISTKVDPPSFRPSQVESRLKKMRERRELRENWRERKAASAESGNADPVTVRAAVVDTPTAETSDSEKVLPTESEETVADSGTSDFMVGFAIIATGLAALAIVGMSKLRS